MVEARGWGRKKETSFAFLFWKASGIKRLVEAGKGEGKSKQASKPEAIPSSYKVSI